MSSSFFWSIFFCHFSYLMNGACANVNGGNIFKCGNPYVFFKTKIIFLLMESLNELGGCLVIDILVFTHFQKIISPLGLLMNYTIFSNHKQISFHIMICIRLLYCTMPVALKH